MTAEHLKGLNTRDLLLGIFYHLPENTDIHKYDLMSYLLERFDVSTTEIKDNLKLLCGYYHSPIILKSNNAYFSYQPQNKRLVENFIKSKFTEEQLNSLEKLTYQLIEFKEI